eukprot:GHVO01053504.1.p2 GENE.GHVO01053504.1~~GHVO01053504.1.p2  ORF type:complete len:120 (+),score=22.73 GHVO01053504.1:351-710(+)
MCCGIASILHQGIGQPIEVQPIEAIDNGLQPKPERARGRARDEMPDPVIPIDGQDKPQPPVLPVNEMDAPDEDYRKAHANDGVWEHNQGEFEDDFEDDYYDQELMEEWGEHMDDFVPDM